MAVRLRPPERQIEEFLELLDLGVEKYEQAADVLDARTDVLLQASQLVGAFSEVLDLKNSELLVRHILSLSGLTRRFDVKAEEIVASLGAALISARRDTPSFNETWNRFAVILIRFLKCRIVRLAATAIELSYDYANLVRNVRILSDIRPLYDEEADRIEAAVISHTMRLHYDSADGEHDLSLAMDEEDIRKLLEQCTRALKKSKTAKDSIDFPAIIQGESAGVAK